MNSLISLDLLDPTESQDSGTISQDRSKDSVEHHPKQPQGWKGGPMLRKGRQCDAQAAVPSGKGVTGD